MAVTPHSVAHIPHSLVHHLNPCAVSLWTSLPMWRPAWCDVPQSLHGLPSSLLSLLTYALADVRGHELVDTTHLLNLVEYVNQFSSNLLACPHRLAQHARSCSKRMHLKGS
jgi:hypothetical protein